VVNYDSAKQFRVLSAAYSILEGYQRSAREFFARTFEKVLSGVSRIQSPGSITAVSKQWALWVTFIPIVIVLLNRRWRRRLISWLHRALHPGNAGVAAASFYKEALAMLGDRGLRRDRGQTPLEFAHSLGDHPSRAPFLTLTQIYNSIRFGPPGVPFNHTEAQTQLRLLRDSLRRS